MTKNTIETVKQAALDAVSKAIADDLPDRANTFAGVYNTLVYSDKSSVTYYAAKPLLQSINGEASKAKTGVQAIEVTPQSVNATEAPFFCETSKDLV